MAIAGKLRGYPFNFAALKTENGLFSYQIAKLQSCVYDHLEVIENGAARVF